MPSAQFNRLIDEARSLPPDEQRMLRNYLDVWLENQGKVLSEREEWELFLFKEGLVSRIRPPLTEEVIERYRNWKPVPIEGEPLSETVIRERR